MMVMATPISCCGSDETLDLLLAMQAPGSTSAALTGLTGLHFRFSSFSDAKLAAVALCSGALLLVHHLAFSGGKFHVLIEL